MDDSKEDKYVNLGVDKVSTKKRDKVERYALMKMNIMPSHCFRLAITGNSGSGKSSLLVNLLTTRNRLYNYFDKIIIFSPTFDSDEIWRTFEEKYDPYNKSGRPKKKLITDYEHYDTCDEQEIERILQAQRESIEDKGLDKADKLLVIFDDCIAEKQIGGNTIKKLFTQGRHYNLSVCILSQSYMRIPRDLRLQLSHLCIFLPNQSECQRIAEEQQNLYCDAKRLENIIYQACKEKHSFLFINKQANPHQWYRKRFDEVFLLE